MSESRTLETPALILTVYPYRDLDLMVRVFAPELGSVSALAFRARQSRSRFPSGVDGITLVDAAFTRKQDGFLTLTRSHPKELYWRLKADFDRTCAASLLCELLMRTHAESDDATRLFAFATWLLAALDAQPGPSGPVGESPGSAQEWSAPISALSGPVGALIAALEIPRLLRFLPRTTACAACVTRSGQDAAAQRAARGPQPCRFNLQTGEITCPDHAGRGFATVLLDDAETAFLDSALAHGASSLAGVDPVQARALLTKLTPFLEQLFDGPLKSLGFLR